jgi:myosin heavy subunit
MSEMMLAQLRYAGLLEVCRIRQIGYPVRKSFDDFVFRYRCLALTAARDHVTLLSALAEKGIAKKNQWQIGHTKVFMRNLQQFEFEAARDLALTDVVKKMQAQARRFIVRCRYIKWVAILNVVREAMKARTLERMDLALQDVPELPNLGRGAGAHLKLIRDAFALKERLELEKRVTELLQSAIAERDLASLQNAVKMADDMVFSIPLVGQAKALIERLLEERRVLAELKKAIERRDKPSLEANLVRAAELDLQSHDLYKQAVALKIRMEEEEAVRVVLRDAIKAQSLEALDSALDKMVKMGLSDEPLYKEGVDLKDFLTKQLEARAALRDAIKARSLDELESAMTLAAKASLPASTPELVEAQGLKGRLVEEQKMEADLVKIADSKDIGAVNAALARAINMGLPSVRKVLVVVLSRRVCVIALDVFWGHRIVMLSGFTGYGQGKGDQSSVGSGSTVRC